MTPEAPKRDSVPILNRIIYKIGGGLVRIGMYWVVLVCVGGVIVRTPGGPLITA